MNTKFILFLIISVVVLNSCAPVFSELQSARTVGKNRIELTPSFSSVSYASDGNNSSAANVNNEVQRHFGFQTAYGLSSNTDIRMRYEYIWISDNSSDVPGINVLGVGPKYCYIKERLSFYLPIGLAFGKDINSAKTWELQPTLLISIPVAANKFELNFSPKYLIPFTSNNGNHLALNFGASFSDDLTKWAIRPEYGILFYQGNSSYFSHFSIGFSLCFGN
jgi:hypothetical protein